MCATCGCMGNRKAAKKAPAASKNKGSKGKKKAAKGKLPPELLEKFAKKKK